MTQGNQTTDGENPTLDWFNGLISDLQASEKIGRADYPNIKAVRKAIAGFDAKAFGPPVRFSKEVAQAAKDCAVKRREDAKEVLCLVRNNAVYTNRVTITLTIPEYEQQLRPLLFRAAGENKC